MLYKTLIDNLADRLKLPDKSDVNGRAILGQKINESYKEVARSHPWEYLKRTADIETVANLTGTATVTNGSRVVTGSATNWDATLKGRYFQPLGSSNWYRIVGVISATSLTLEQPIIEATATTTYTIWKRYYYLLSEVQKVLNFSKWLNNYNLQSVSPQTIEDTYNNPSNADEPQSQSNYGTDSFLPSYSTGSISMTQDSQTVTGVGTSWLGNVGAGDLFIVNNIEYRIKRVESDTQIILYQYAFATVPAGGTYLSIPDNPLGIQFYPTANKAYIFPYTYQKRVFNMVNENNDRPELPEDFDWSILDGAEYSRLKELNDPRWQPKFQEYSTRLIDLKIRLGKLNTPRYRQFSPYIPTRSAY